MNAKNLWLETNLITNILSVNKYNNQDKKYDILSAHYNKKPPKIVNEDNKAERCLNKWKTRIKIETFKNEVDKNTKMLTLHGTK
jgi:hypothetical protein